MKANRNKTIDLTIEEGKKYLEKTITIDMNVDIQQIVNKTILGNTFEVLKHLPKDSIDLLVVDPPYNLDKNFDGNQFKKMDECAYVQYTEEWISLVKPLLKKNATLYVCCDWKCSSEIYTVLCKHFIIRNRITWQREKGRGALSNWKNAMEDIWYATVSNDYTFNVEDVKMRRKVIAPYKVNGKPKDWETTESGNYRNTYPSNFWDDISIPYWSMPENTLHPTQKPEKLIAKLILASSNKGDLILDPFLGSGTTSVVAKKLDRKYVGIEQSQQFCVWAEKRLEVAQEDSNIQGYTNGVFWERNTLAEQKKISTK